MVVLFLLMVMGYGAHHLHIMDKDFNARLSNLLIKIAVPCMIIASVGQENPFTDAASLFWVLAVSTLVNLLAPVFAWIFIKLLRFKTDKNAYQFMFSLTNAGFMGLPVIQSIFGDTAMAYAAIFLLPNNLLMFIYGQQLFQKQDKLDLKKIFNAPVVCSLIACAISLFHISEPAWIYELTDMVGGVTTPLAMLIIGASLADVPFSEVIHDKRLIPFTLIKMFVIPVVYYLFLSLFVKDQNLLIVCVMIMAMPVATNAVIFSSAYGGNTDLTSRCVFVTSTISVLSIPLICLLFV